MNNLHILDDSLLTRRQRRRHRYRRTEWVPMFKFGGWRASLDFSGQSRHKEVYENGPELSAGGAYRTHREDFFGRNSISEPPKKLTPSMVKLPPSNDKLKTTKSANDLTQPLTQTPQLRKSAHDISTDPKGGTSSNRNSSALHKNTKQKTSSKEDKKQEKEQKNAEKKRLADQKKQEKTAKQEQAKKDKIRIQQEKKIVAQQAKDVKARKGKEKKKSQGTLPQASVTKALVPQAPPPPPERVNPTANYPTNTLDSSISRTSGPPPYTESKPPEKRPNNKDSTGNTSFSKPIENSSWDLISEHRSQINRNPVASGSTSKQMVMDLQFSFDRAQTDDRDNSEV